MSKALDSLQVELDAFKAELEAFLSTAQPVDTTAATAAAEADLDALAVDLHTLVYGTTAAATMTRTDYIEAATASTGELPTASTPPPPPPTPERLRDRLRREWHENKAAMA